MKLLSKMKQVQLFQNKAGSGNINKGSTEVSKVFYRHI